MKSDKLILQVHKANLITGNIVRIDTPAADIIKQIQLETGLSATHIISEMIKFSADKIEVEEVK